MGTDVMNMLCFVMHKQDKTAPKWEKQEGVNTCCILIHVNFEIL